MQSWQRRACPVSLSNVRCDFRFALLIKLYEYSVTTSTVRSKHDSKSNEEGIFKEIIFLNASLANIFDVVVSVIDTEI